MLKIKAPRAKQDSDEDVIKYERAYWPSSGPNIFANNIGKATNVAP